jgi:hypothetical protein
MTPPTPRASLLESLRKPGEDGNPFSSRTDFWNPTVNIRFVEGHCMTFLYAHLQWMNFDPSIGVILHFSTHTVKVFGRNLAGLYGELLELKRREIVEVSVEHDLEPPDAAVVHRVEVAQIGSPGNPAKPRNPDPEEAPADGRDADGERKPGRRKPRRGGSADA